jgi:2-polyprenyl-3-methyl-5-hydroxy-6-metoxy-1,4-benzoquinol methylase
LLEGSPCIVCGRPRRVRVAAWTARCEACGAWASDLPVGGHEVDSDTRVAGYEALRRENFRVILDRLAARRALGGLQVLDVGSAYGWFLDEAAKAGAEATGVEPDERVAARSLGEVRVGRFPDVLAPGDRFDVIAFNDVLEHIPDVRGALQACRTHLRPGGLLSLNIPTADGLAFRTAAALARVKLTGPYRRLWQCGLASPHLHYFPTRALLELVASSGIDVQVVDDLAPMTREGLWQRVHTVRRPGPTSVLGFAGLYAACGILNRPGSSDIVHLIGERPVE